MTYRVGELDQRIAFQKKTETPDGFGGSSVVWADIDSLANVWAHVRAKSGRERLEADRVEASANYIFIIRNRSDLSEDMRIVWDGTPYNIRSLLQAKSRAMYLEIDAERGVAQ